MFNLLLIDNNNEIKEVIKKLFLHTANVASFSNLKLSKDFLNLHETKIIIIDIDFHEEDIYNWIGNLKSDEKFFNIPIIILSAQYRIQDMVLAFQMGAEDYLIKPFNPIELKIRVESKIKNNSRSKEALPLTIIENLTINSIERVVTLTKDNTSKNVELTATEFRILNYFANNKEHVIEREQLISAIWNYGCHISDRTIDSHISRIRKKINESNYSIFAVQKVGYKFTNGRDE